MHNLLANACQAVLECDQTSQVVTVSAQRARDAIEITVSDSGPGIPRETREQVFEPLYSTKPFGVGLGLPHVRNIARRHGGDVRIEDLDHGASVVIWLPAPVQQ